MLTIHKAGLTLVQRTADGKSNEIPAVQELLKELNIKGHMVVADAFNCQKEWSVESMHWLLDVHFEEDWCRVEDKTVQSNLNIFRKAAINLIKIFKSRTESKNTISKIMLDCLLDAGNILSVIAEN